MSAFRSSKLVSPTLRTEVRRAAVLGMSQETRDAWDLLVRRLSEGPLTLLGAPGPSRVLLDRAIRAGALEGALDDPQAPTHRVVVPLTGATVRQRRQWKERGHELIDLTLPSIRRAHAALGLLRAEGCRLVLGGHRGAAECAAIAGKPEGVAIVDSADDAAALPFAPQSGIVFQTSISSQRARAIVEALRQRYRDSHLQVLDTLSPAALDRERALRALAREVEILVIIADPADSSGKALFETARWLGRPALITRGAAHLDLNDLAGFRHIGLSAGEFTSEEQIAAVEAKLQNH